MNIFIPVITSRGWNLKRSLELLSVIEDGFLSRDSATEDDDEAWEE